MGENSNECLSSTQKPSEIHSIHPSNYRPFGIHTIDNMQSTSTAFNCINRLNRNGGGVRSLVFSELSFIYLSNSDCWSSSSWNALSSKANIKYRIISSFVWFTCFNGTCRTDNGKQSRCDEEETAPRPSPIKSNRGHFYCCCCWCFCLCWWMAMCKCNCIGHGCCCCCCRSSPAVLADDHHR